MQLTRLPHYARSAQGGIRRRVALAGLAAVLVLGGYAPGHDVSAAAAPAAAAAGVLYAWGSNEFGELGIGPPATAPTSSAIPLQVSLPAGVAATAVSAAGYTVLALGSDGNVYAWGDNSDGQLGDGSTSDSYTPVPVPLPVGVTATAVSEGGLTSAAIGSDGNIYAWGQNISAQPGVYASYSTAPVQMSLPGGLRVTALSAGDTTILVLGSDGNIYEWASNGSDTNFAAPVQVPLPGGVTATAISGGVSTTLAVASNGSVYAWGSNQYGQLGNGSTTNSSVPVLVAMPAGVTGVAVSEGENASFALGSDGNAYAWGYNDLGQLGDGSTTDSLTPVRVLLPSGVSATAISGGGDLTSLALGSDGNLYAWGSNASGQLGANVTGSSSVPLVISLPGRPTATAVTEGANESLVIASGGTGPTATSTSLTATPDPSSQGRTVALTATVSAADGSEPVGFVDFEIGITTIGSVAVNASGIATMTTTFAQGSYALVALFTPTQVPYALSSGTLSLSVSGPQTGGSVPVLVSVPVTGTLTVTVATTAINLAVGTGPPLTATGTLNTVTVSDTRNTFPGWSVSGQDTAFTGSGTAAGSTISGDDLGWTPTGTVSGGAVFGAAVPPASPGLAGFAQTLALAAPGSGMGTDSLTAILTLDYPPTALAGPYTSTLTITYLLTGP